MWLTLADLGISYKTKQNKLVYQCKILKKEIIGLVVLCSPHFLMTDLHKHKHSKKKDINIVTTSPINTHIHYITNKEGHTVFFVWPQEIGLISSFTCTALFPQEGKRCAPNPRERSHACLIWSIRLQCLLWHAVLKRSTGYMFWWKAECSADDKVTSSQQSVRCDRFMAANVKAEFRHMKIYGHTEH